MIKLTVITAGQEVDTHTLEEGDTVIGRSRSCDIRLQAPDISRSHLKLTVAGEKISAENMGRNRSRLNDKPIEGIADISPGDVIQVGEGTSLRIEAAPDAEEAPASDTGDDDQAAVNTIREVTPEPSVEDNADVTGEDALPDPASADADLTSAATGEDIGPPADSEATRAHETMDAVSSSYIHQTMARGGDDFHTMAMQTRAVSPEEIEFLREAEQKRTRNRLLLGLSIVIPVAALAIIFRPKPLPPETVIEWPKDAAGEYLDGYEPAPSGGFAGGGYDINYPATRGAEVTPTVDGLAISCLIGRKRDVTLRLTLSEQRDNRFLTMNRADTLREWMKEISNSEGHWNFDKPYPMLSFIGDANGIPAMTVSYHLEHEGSWFGWASFFRHGNRRIVLRAEVPAVDRIRAEDITGANFLRLSPDFVASHWESSGEIPKASATETLEQIQAGLARMAPATWAEIENLIVGVLTKAAATDRADLQRQAQDLLLELRRRQNKWFHSQALARDNAIAEGNEKRATRITKYARAVFSNTEDYRYFQVRKW